MRRRRARNRRRSINRKDRRRIDSCVGDT